MRRALRFLAAILFVQLVAPRAAWAALPSPSSILWAQSSPEPEEEEEEEAPPPKSQKKKKAPVEEEEYPEALPLGVPAPRREEPPPQPEAEPEPPKPPPKAPAKAPPVPAPVVAPVLPPPDEGRGGEGSSQLARPIEMPLESYSDLLVHWGKRRALLQQHDPGGAQAEADEIRRLRADLAVINLSEFAAALIRESERARATRAPAEAVARCELAVELAPALPAAHRCLARATLAKSVVSVVPATRSLLNALGATMSDVRNRRAFVADAAVVVLGGILFAGALFLLLCFARLAPLLFHDFHHLFPAGATRLQTGLVLSLVLLTPFIFNLGPVGVVVIVAAAAALYLGLAEAVVVGAMIALLAGLPYIGGAVARSSAFGGAALDVYQVEREGESGRAADRLALRTQSEKPRFEELFALARLYKRQGKLPEARALLEKASQVRPDSAAVQNNLGNVHLLAGDLSAAKLAYTRANELDPTLAAAHYNVSNAYFREANLTGGDVALKRAKELDPDGIAAFIEKGDVKANRFLIDVAIDDDAIAALNDPVVGERVQSEIEARLSGALPSPAALAAPLVMLALLGLARIARGKLRPSRSCEKCGRAVCVRCSPELGPSDVLCGQCLNVFVKKKSVDAAERIRKEVSIARYQTWKRRIGLVASLFAGAGHVLGGRPVRGALLLGAISLVLARIFLWDGFVRSPVPVTASAGGVAMGLLLAVALLLSILSVRDTWKSKREEEVT